MARSSIQMQFNWIFVLIAGAVILASVFAFISKQKGISEKKIADTLIKDIETLATVAATGKGAEPIQTPRTEVRFVCDETCSCNIEVGAWTRSFKEKLIFSPKSLEGTSMLFWAMDWKVPFRVTNFLLLTNRQVKYFFIYGDDSFSKGFYQQVRDLIPESIDFEFSKVDLFNAKDDDYEKVRFVFIGVDPGSLSEFLDESFEKVDVSAVQLMRGKAIFYKKTDPKKLAFATTEHPVFGDAAYFAAMIAEDSNMYRCNMQRAFRKLSTISEILHIRAEYLQDKTSETNLLCGYQAAMDHFQSYIDLGNQARFNIDSPTGFPYEALEATNHELLLEGCPLVY